MPDDHLEEGDPRSTREVLESMEDRILKGFDIATRALCVLEEVLMDQAETIKAVEGRLGALEGRHRDLDQLKEVVMDAEQEAGVDGTAQELGEE